VRTLAFALALAFAAAGAAGAATTPGAGAQAWGVRVVTPDGTVAASAVANVPAAAAAARAPLFAYPADGSVVSAGRVTADARMSVEQDAAATATASAFSVRLFGGEITAAAVVSGAAATAHGARARGALDGGRVVDLRAFGKRVTRARVTLADWGYLAVGVTSVEHTGRTYRGHLLELEVTLTADHGGLPAGSRIELGDAEAEAATAPLPPLPLPPPTTPLLGPQPGDRPQLLPHVTGPLVGVPQIVTPALAGGPYVFPVFGPARYVDGYGTAAAAGGYQSGDDIFGQLGQPLVAVASGSVFDVGWNRFGGNRFRLRDHDGNVFYYAHLAAFSTSVRDGAHVSAGEVVGFMGDTGTSEDGRAHLHFEVHPVSLLYFGAGGAVDPTSYLASWRKLDSLPFAVAAGWAPTPRGVSKAPLPGAVLIGRQDIASNGLGAARR